MRWEVKVSFTLLLALCSGITSKVPRSVSGEAGGNAGRDAVETSITKEASKMGESILRVPIAA